MISVLGAEKLSLDEIEAFLSASEGVRFVGLGHMTATQRLGSIQYSSGTIFALFAGRG